MRFVIDQQLPPALVRWLGAKGHQADHVHDLGLSESEDEAIWQFAFAQNAVILTKDIDFAHRRQARSDGPAIIWIRIGNTTREALFEILANRWPAIEEALAHQAAVVEVL